MTIPEWFVKKPVKVQALKFEYSKTGLDALKSFCGSALVTAGKDRHPGAKGWAEIGTLEDGQGLGSQAKHIATEGDYIIKGVKGEFYACKPDIFAETYESSAPPPAKLQFVEGDLIKMALEGRFDFIIHGCNCFCTMGSGIAKTIKETWPGAYEADCRTMKGDFSKLGNWSIYNGDSCSVVNLYTQVGYNTGRESYDRFEYAHFQRGLTELLSKYGDAFIGLPEIGMGRAGGNREKILSCIDKATEASGFVGTITMVKFKEDNAST